MTLVPAPAQLGQPAEPELPQHYAGLVTRGISFAVDAAAINLVAIIVSVGAALVLSLIHIPSTLKPILGAIAGAIYILWSVGYFVVLWSATGQTLGARVMQIRVLTTSGTVIKPHVALVRCGATLLAALPLFAGFVPVLFDERRRAFQDRVVGTVVEEIDQLSILGGRRERMRTRYEESKTLS